MEKKLAFARLQLEDGGKVRERAQKERRDEPEAKAYHWYAALAGLS